MSTLVAHIFFHLYTNMRNKNSPIASSLTAPNSGEIHAFRLTLVGQLNGYLSFLLQFN